MKINSPFKPIKTKSPTSGGDPLLDFMKEEAEKSAAEIKADTERKSDENFKAELKEPKFVAAPEVTKYKLHIKKSDIFVTQERWATLTSGLYLDVFNADKAHMDIAGEIKEIMNRNGIEVNTDDVDKMLSDTQDRMLKVYLAKNMCLSLGMHREWDAEILSRELDLVYPERPLLGTPKTKSTT